MKTALSFAAACGLLATLANAQPAPPSAQDFVNKVALSDMLEIQSSQLALAKQADVDTKPFAEKMVADHQKTSSELKSLVEGGKVKATLPAALERSRRQTGDVLDHRPEHIVGVSGTTAARMRSSVPSDSCSKSPDTERGGHR